MEQSLESGSEINGQKGQTKLFPETQSINSEKCVFCKVAKEMTTVYTVFRDEVSMAFLDKRPVFLGHCLLIPLSHYETLSDLPDNLIQPLFSNARTIATAVERSLGANGTFVAINNKVSQSVPHLHIHVVPRRIKDGLRAFFWPKQSYRE